MASRPLSNYTSHNATILDQLRLMGVQQRIDCNGRSEWFTLAEVRGEWRPLVVGEWEERLFWYGELAYTEWVHAHPSDIRDSIIAADALREKLWRLLWNCGATAA